MWIVNVGLKSKIYQFFLLIIFKIVYQFFFLTYSVIYNIDLDISVGKVIAGWSVYLLYIGLATFKVKDMFYSVGIIFLILTCVVSTISLYEMEDILLYDFFKALMYWFLVLFGFIIYQKKSSDKSIFHLLEINQLQYLLFYVSAIFTLIMSGIYAGFRITLSLDEVYTYRLEMRMASMPAIVNYLFYFFGGTIIPYCFAFFLAYKKRLYAISSLFLGIMIFSINGMKTWLLVYALILGVFVGFGLNNKKINLYIIGGFILLTVGSIYLYSNKEDINLMAILGRVYYIPSRIGYNYIDFFDKNEFLYLRESILKFFFDSPYPVHSAFYIVDGAGSDVSTSRANNGLWGDAYGNFGIVGMLVYPFMLCYIMSLLKRSMRGMDPRLVTSIVILALWISVNSSFFVWLITGGVLLLLFINEVTVKSYRKDVGDI